MLCYSIGYNYLWHFDNSHILNHIALWRRYWCSGDMASIRRERMTKDGRQFRSFFSNRLQSASSDLALFLLSMSSESNKPRRICAEICECDYIGYVKDESIGRYHRSYATCLDWSHGESSIDLTWTTACVLWGYQPTRASTENGRLSHASSYRRRYLLSSYASRA